MTRVFISHSSRDAGFVLARIKPVFDQAGILAWCSAMDVRAAADWERQIRTALSQADWFLVVLSPDAQQSDWVKSETHWALEHMRGRIIPVMARGCDPCEVHLRLGMIQYIDFRSDPEQAGTRLLDLIAGRGPDAVPEPGPEHQDAAPQHTTLIRDLRRAVLTLFIESPGAPGFERVLEVHRAATIGRAADADLQIADDCISRKHARIGVLSTDGSPYVTLTDLDSANGTFLNDQRLRAEQRLTTNDIVELGNTRLHVRAITGPAATDP
jgi:hypothetical protein